MINAKAVYHVGLPANDLVRATKFYTEVFGMKFLSAGQDDHGYPYKEAYGVYRRFHG